MSLAHRGFYGLLALTALTAHALADVWTPERIVGLEYPSFAVVNNLEGVVTITCYMANDGSVSRAEAVSGRAQLASIAIRNAMQWRFRRVDSGEATYILVYRFQIVRPSRGTSPLGFRFIMPGEVLVTAQHGDHSP
jgi:hypothetical protein